MMDVLESQEPSTLDPSRVGCSTYRHKAKVQVFLLGFLVFAGPDTQPVILIRTSLDSGRQVLPDLVHHLLWKLLLLQVRRSAGFSSERDARTFWRKPAEMPFCPGKRDGKARGSIGP